MRRRNGHGHFTSLAVTARGLLFRVTGFCANPSGWRAAKVRVVSGDPILHTGLGVNPRGWTVGVGWIDRLRVSGCIHTLEFLRRPVAEGGVQASSIVYLLKEVGESVG